MKILIATDFHCQIYHGEYYLAPKIYTILKRYADAFGDVVLCSRSTEVTSLSSEDKKAEFVVDIVAINDLKKALIGCYDKQIAAAATTCDLVIVRLHSFVGFRAADVARKLHKPYLAESMGDAWDAFWNHGAEGKILAPYMYFKMKDVVKHADYATYVTSHFLQKRYPCPNPSIAASNVLIEDVNPEVLEKRLQKISGMAKGYITLMTTAAVDVKYKGQQYVIKAIPALNRAGIEVKYIVLGEGSQDYLKSVAKKCGVEEQVYFAGRQPLEKVFEFLDETDLYIQPSLQEGLPRSVIEAMSRGCPCIGANTAGIPELLEPQHVVQRKSITDIVKKVIEFRNSAETIKRKNAERNFDESKLYTKAILDERRNNYFAQIQRKIKDDEHVCG